ncbi:nucleotide-binding alpha-beta plait domain-containing protein [Tanacetum coccineum]
MGSYRTKKDDVAKISTSVFITNFPESLSAKELFHSCKKYGHVVDMFIPTKRSKAGKRFGFVRFHRTPVNGVKNLSKDAGGEDIESVPAVVLDDECLLSKDLSKSLLGRVKEFASLANLKMALTNEGFVDIKIQYMGELWVMLEFVTEESIKLFRDNVSVGSWFSQFKQASMDFVTESRIAWVEIEGIPFKLWSSNTFKRIAAKWGELLDVDDQEDMCFHSKRLCIHTKPGRSILEEFKIIHRGKVYWIRANETPGWVPDFADESDDEDQDDVKSKDGGFNDHEPGCGGSDTDVEEVPKTLFEVDGQVNNNLEEHMETQEDKSEDPFKIYSLLNKNNNMAGKDNKSEGTDANSMHAEGDINDNVVDFSDCKMDGANDVSSGGSILGILDEVVKVGQVMRYKMDGCLAKKAKKDWVKELCIKNKVNFLALQETKMDNMDLLCVRTCWGNLAFDYVYSDSVGNSGGILCVWDPNSFCKSNVTISDYFVMVRGVWRLTGQNFLLIAVYAPQDGTHFDLMVPLHISVFFIRFDDGWILKNLKRDALEGRGPCEGSNAMRRMMAQYKIDLEAVDSIIDNGKGTAEDVKKRVEIVNKLQGIDKVNSLEVAQKAKVKWAVEGDENSSFFHGMLNKKRNLLNIRGVLADGIWIDNPNRVKREFLDHFSNRFCKPGHSRAILQMSFPKSLSSDQQRELESEVTNDEIKKGERERGGEEWASEADEECARALYGVRESHQWCSVGKQISFNFHEDFDEKIYLYLYTLTVERGSSRGSIINNGNPTKVFNLAKGFKQGIRCLPILFILNMKAFTYRFNGGGVAGVLRMLESIRSHCQALTVRRHLGLIGRSEGGKLKNRYPRLYALESCKSISVGLKLAQPSLAFSFRRASIGGAEQEQFDEVVDLVKVIMLAPVSDRWTWELESSGDFSVASVRKLIDVKLLPGVDYKTRWIKFVPIKVNVHAWKVMSDSLPTRFNISRRGICIDNIRCVICDKGVETSSHLFFSCCMVRQVICLISRWWGVTEVEFESYDGWLAWLVNLRLPYRNKLMLEGVFYVMWWFLWTFRNKLIFEAKAPLKAMFFDDVVTFKTMPVLTSIPILIGELRLVKVTLGLQEELAGKQTECSVCLDPFNCQQEVYRLPCGHYFHKVCIVPWFLRKNTCPVCCDSYPIPDLLVQQFRRFSIPITNEDNLQYYRQNALSVCQEHGTEFQIEFPRSGSKP